VEPTNSSWIDAKRPRYVDQSFAISQPLQRFLTLMLIKLSRAPEPYPASLGTLSSIIGGEAGLDL
jgi:hypothetical protein